MPYIWHYIILYCHISVLKYKGRICFVVTKNGSILRSTVIWVIYFTISYFTYKPLSNFEITIFSCNLCVAEILSPRFASAPRFVETRWTMLRDASNKQMPRTNKTCVEPNAEFSKIQPTKYMEKTKFHLQQEKHCHLPEVRSFEFHLMCLLSNHVELWFSPLHLFFLILCPSLGSSIHCIFLLFLSLPLSTRCKIWFFRVLHRWLRWHEA